jgi:hypothetical protein
MSFEEGQITGVLKELEAGARTGNLARRQGEPQNQNGPKLAIMPVWCGEIAVKGTTWRQEN